MVAKLYIITAFAALATAVPQHAEHIGKSRVVRDIFGAGDLAERGVSQDGSCGAAAGGNSCPDSYCCSSIGWCGNSPLHCGTGCQSAFGKCDSGSTNVSPAAITTTTTTSSTAVSTSTTAAPVVAATLATVVSSGDDGKKAAAPIQSSTSSGSSSGLGDSYTMYLGDGSTAAGWPAQSSWVSDFPTMFEKNRDVINSACTQFGQANNDNSSETEVIRQALNDTAAANNIDARFLLAVMMQESKGCVRAPTTNWGVRNPGLFQSHNGVGTCNDGTVLNPCPPDMIKTMVTDGGVGTGTASDKGPGLSEILGGIGSTDVSDYYKAARIYNAGSLAASNKLEAPGATPCYASDVANRLTGWVTAAHGCTLV